MVGFLIAGHNVYLLPPPLRLLLLVIPCRKPTNSTGTGARQSATDSAQLVNQIITLYESKPLVFKALYASHECRTYKYARHGLADVN